MGVIFVSGRPPKITYNATGVAPQKRKKAQKSWWRTMGARDILSPQMDSSISGQQWAPNLSYLRVFFLLLAIYLGLQVAATGSNSNCGVENQISCQLCFLSVWARSSRKVWDHVRTKHVTAFATCCLLYSHKIFFKINGAPQLPSKHQRGKHRRKWRDSIMRRKLLFEGELELLNSGRALLTIRERGRRGRREKNLRKPSAVSFSFSFCR